MEDNTTFRMLAETKLPIATGKIVDAVIFGTDEESPDVITLINKEPNTNPDSAVVRLHSACITSEVLTSTKCDCADQLNMAIDRISQSEWGIVVYLLKHEGRGIGLVNKIHAYSLQAKGLDTVDANLELGFGADDRDFTPAVESLKLLGVERIQLLTNNPKKVEVLRTNGFDVIKRIAMDVPINEDNRGYLEKKLEYFGHQPARCPSTELLTLESAVSLFATGVANDANHTSAEAAVLAIQLIGNSTDARIMTMAHMLRANKRCCTMPMAKTTDNTFVILMPATNESAAQSIAHCLLDDVDSRREQVKMSLATFGGDENIDALVASLKTAIDDHADSNERLILMKQLSAA